MRVLGKVRMAEVGENREKDDGDEQAVYGREEPVRKWEKRLTITSDETLRPF